jgi:hypothetical protein
VFPEIIYLNHAVGKLILSNHVRSTNAYMKTVIGILHGIFGRVLLMCRNAKFPRIGPDHKQALQKLEVKITFCYLIPKEISNFI